jgi:FixJ family two-component response regulator
VARQVPGTLCPRIHEGAQRPLEQEIQTVLIVDDDPSVLRALDRLIRTAGFAVRSFASPGALLRSEIPRTSVCLVVDVNLPEMNGVDLCELLAATGRGLPAILITGQTDPMTNRLIGRAGAVATLHKPFAAASLFEALAAAFSKGAEQH